MIPFPKYQINISSNNKGEIINNSSWIYPRKTAKKTIIPVKNKTNIILSNNKFQLPMDNENVNIHNKPAVISNTTPFNLKPTNRFNDKSSIFNISNTSLTNAEKAVLEKGLKFCP